MNDFDQLSLATIAARYRDGSLSPRAVAEQCLTNYTNSEQALGAYKSWVGDDLLAQADLAGRAFAAGRDTGALQGMPCSAKDLYGVPGLPVFAGSPRELPAVWQRPGPIMAGLLGQLALITGKTHTVEFAFGGLGSNPHWTMPTNPWDAGYVRVPGGSSAGAGVSLATGTALIALGTDTAGSVRIPASMTGNVGLKTTHGRWSLDGIVPLSPSLDTAGLLTRSVADMIYAFQAIDGQAVPERRGVAGLCLGVPDSFFWDDCDAGVVAAVETAINELVRFGARKTALDLDDTDAAYAYFRKGGLVPPELYAFLRRELPEWIETLDPAVRNRMDAGCDIAACDYLERRHFFERAGARAAAQLQDVDVLAVPAVAVTPPREDDIATSEDYARLNILALRNTSIANLLGLCAITLPVGVDASGMPVGLMLMARPRDETRLLGIAAAIENCLGDSRECIGQPPRLAPSA